MSTAAQVSLIVGVALLLLTMATVLLWDKRTPPPDQIEDPEVRMHWEQMALAAAEDFGLGKTRGAAGKWAASAAAILGILSTVAVVAGPSDLAKDVGGDEAVVAAALVLVAAGFAALATLLAGLAEQGTPVWGRVSGDQLRATTRARAQKAVLQIRCSRILTVLALVLIVSAAGVAWLTALTGSKTPSAQSALVVSTAGAKCGTLSVTKQGALVLFVGGTAEAIPSDARVTLVDSCPS